MPKPETVDRALQEIRKGYAQYQYFFERLTSPAWLEPLSELGFFKHPPPPERVDQYVRLPFWPESKYLVRMSSIPDAQKAVLRITLAVPNSENSRVYDDIAEIALLLPPQLSAKLVPQIADGTQLPIKLVLAEKIGALIVHLCKGGEREAAATLTRVALALAPDPRADQKEDLRFPEPQAHFRDWHYARIVSKTMPTLVTALGLEAVRLFSDLLDDAIRLSRKSDDDQDSDEDYLYISHPAVEREDNRDDIRGILLSAVRDASQQLIAADSSQFVPVLEILDGKRWVSFRRLKLHLCRVFPKQGVAVAEQAFQNPELLNRGSLEHEAVLLLMESFLSWSPGSQKRLLEWIDRGLSEDSIRKWLELTGQPVTDENIRQLSDLWRRDHYAVLQGQIPEPYQRKLDDLLAKRGSARPLGNPRIHKSGAFWAESPKPAEDFNQMSVDDIIEFLASWSPGTGMFEATAEGAGQKLGAVVGGKPDQFVVVAKEFERLDPTYVRAFFEGLTSALKQKHTFDWEPVLALARWVTAQPREVPGRKGGLMVADPDWGWTRDAIIDLLSAGFDEGLDGRITEDDRQLVWTVLRPLTEDPNPSSADEIWDPRKAESPVLRLGTQGDERVEHLDPAALSINTTRGRAMHAVFKYARWLRLITDPERKRLGIPSITFDEMPEVRAVLEARLEIDKEPTRTIRSVYGDHLAWLAWLDWNWFLSNLNRILPTAETEYPLYRAAWNSFVIFNAPSSVLLPVLMGAYRNAIQHLGRDVAIRHSVRSPEECLAEHLMVYYWHGELHFGGDDRLLDDFYAIASAEVRGQAIWFIGISVAGWNDDVPAEAFARLQDLWARRIASARSAGSPESFSKELINFGYWFTSEKFDEHWSIDALLQALVLSKKAEPETQVVKRLAEICPIYPVECVSCLRLMIEGDREGWFLLGMEDDVRLVLRRALDSNNPAGALLARRLVEELLAKGQFGFRNLLT